MYQGVKFFTKVCLIFSFASKSSIMTCLGYYCNLNFGLTTKARACKGVGQEWSPKVTFHTCRSAGECEKMNPQILKWAPTLGVGVPMDFQILKGDCKGQNSLDGKNNHIIGNRPRQGKVKGKRVIQLNLLLPYSLPYPIATC